MINPYIIYRHDEFYQKTWFHIKPIARPDGLVIDKSSSQVAFLLGRPGNKVRRGHNFIYRDGDILRGGGSLAGNLTLGIDIDQGKAAIKSQPDVLGIAWVNDDTGELEVWEPNETF